MGKEPLHGTQWYYSKGYKNLTIFVPKQTYVKIARYAKKLDKSLQKTIRGIITDFAKKI